MRVERSMNMTTLEEKIVIEIERHELLDESIMLHYRKFAFEWELFRFRQNICQRAKTAVPKYMETTTPCSI